MRAGHGEFLAEIRPAIPLFLRFGGIDYDNSPTAAADLDELIVQAQRVIHRFGGSALQLTLGDKGAYLYAVFGSPIAHEDDAARACAAALELRCLESRTAATGISIGIAQGRLRSGTYGHATRRTFCCLGDAVNLAARLMAACPPGEVYVSAAVARSAGDGYTWAAVPDLPVKGKAVPVAVRRLVGDCRRAVPAARRHALPIVGREEELALLRDRLHRAVTGAGQVVAVSAEAGMGKSRLISELLEQARAEGVHAYVGEAQAFGTSTSYAAWQDIWAGLLRVDREASAQDQLLALEWHFRLSNAELLPRLPLLGPVLGTSLPDNDLTRSFEGKLRKASLEAMLAQYLTRRAADEPLVLVLEDCHRLDPLSRDLLDVVVAAAASLRVLLVLAYRPTDDTVNALGLGRAAHVSELALGELGEHAARRLIEVKLEQLFGVREPSTALVPLVAERSEGNPFYIEELLSYLRSQGVAPDDEAAIAGLDLPESLQSLVLSRIDTLTESPRRTLKVASVVGRSFSTRTLRGAYPELADEGLDDSLDALSANELVLPDPGAELASYVFKHGVTREVAYESIPYAVRAVLHEQVARHIEAVEGPGVERRLDLLAHHYWHSGNDGKKREYLARAAEAARTAYANAAAIDYYGRLTPLLDEAHRAETLLKLGKVLELTGAWTEAEAVYREALDLGERHEDRLTVAWALTALAEVARKQGRYDEAADGLELAGLAFAALDHPAGTGQVLHQRGTLAAQRGNYAEASASYEQSLVIRRRLGDKASAASLLSNLGVIAEYAGDYARARELNERALALRTEIGDRWAIGVSQNNLGMIALLESDCATARRHFEESMRINVEVGDVWMVAISHNNLGNANRGLQEYAAARHHYAQSLRSYRAYEDKWALSILYEDVAVLAGLVGSPGPALRLVAAAERLRDEIGSPRSPAQQAQLEEALGPAREELGNRAEKECSAGQALDPAEAFALALRVCTAG
nr:tetratricopeptide repeat protein [Motilibacter aurantiacus]